MPCDLLYNRLLVVKCRISEPVDIVSPTVYLCWLKRGYAALLLKIEEMEVYTPFTFLMSAL